MKLTSIHASALSSRPHGVLQRRSLLHKQWSSIMQIDSDHETGQGCSSLDGLPQTSAAVVLKKG
jgi:hypothetical protein